MDVVNRQWIYDSVVTGKLTHANFALREAKVPALRQGQTLVRNKLLSLDPANRSYFAIQTYRPMLQVGDVMAGFGIGEVIESTDARFSPGDLVHGDLGWQDYAILNSFERSEFVYKCTPGYREEDLLGVLGITGLTAYFGLEEVGRLSPGETVVVGGATGACGVIIGQLAKLAGARVVGFGGGDQKCRWLVEEMGFDGAVDYRGENPAASLAALCPDGVDFFSDAIGGVVTQSTIPLMKQNARWYHYGNVSSYDEAVPGKIFPGNNFLTPELAEICGSRALNPVFLLVFDFYCQRKRAEADLARYVREGKLKAPVTTLAGLENLPSALIEWTLGTKRLGKLNLRVAD
jgi:NADPH-dependent curcumin reductase